MSLDKTEEKGGNLVYVVKEIPSESEELKKLQIWQNIKTIQSSREGLFTCLQKPENCPTWASVDDDENYR